jgi:hypothetical protein
MKRKENLRERRESDLWYLKNEGINLRELSIGVSD